MYPAELFPSSPILDIATNQIAFSQLKEDVIQCEKEHSINRRLSDSRVFAPGVDAMRIIRIRTQRIPVDTAFISELHIRRPRSGETLCVRFP